jgi:hypothetical protein
MSSDDFTESTGETPRWIAETLGLDREVLAHVAECTEEWCRALDTHAEEADASTSVETVASEAASLLTIAGSYWMLMDPRRASGVLNEAARRYQDLENRFAHAVAICAGNTRVRRPR